MTEVVRRPPTFETVVRPPATKSGGGDPTLTGVTAALRSLYAPIAERALPIYYGPVLGRLFLKIRR